MCATQQWHLASEADHVSSRSFLGCGAPHSCLLKLSPCSQQQSSAQVCSPNPTLQHLAPACIGRQPSQAGAPGYDQPPSISVYFAARKGTSPDAITSPLLQLPAPKGCGPHPVPSFLFLPLFSFILPGHAGIFSCPLGCLGSFARDQQVLCVNFSTCRCTLDILVGRGEPQVLLFHHLDLDLNSSFQ